VTKTLSSDGYTREGYKGVLWACDQALAMRDGYNVHLSNVTACIRWASREYTQAKLARHLGFSTSYVNDVVKGKRAITEAFVQRVIERGEMK